jgi:hypothetical protein
MRVINYALIATGMAIGVTAYADTPAFTGRFIGTGRACYGTLAVRAKTISWLTSFSQCQSVPYELLERADHGGQQRLSYRLKTGDARCRYSHLSITHDGAAGQDTAWQVTGYASEASYKADKASGYTAKEENMMSCYLIRDPGKTARKKDSR